MYVAPDANPCPTQRRIACSKIFVFECQRDKRFMLQFLFAIHPWNSTPQKNNVFETIPSKKNPTLFFPCAVVHRPVSINQLSACTTNVSGDHTLFLLHQPWRSFAFKQCTHNCFISLFFYDFPPF